MGGSSKPADPKPIPFVEPQGPRNPVPNWFANREQAPAMQPDFTASRNPLGEGGFDWRQPAMQSAPVAQPAPAMPSVQSIPVAPNYSPAPVAPMQAPAVSGPMMPFSIPTQPDYRAMVAAGGTDNLTGLPQRPVNDGSFAMQGIGGQLFDRLQGMGDRFQNWAAQPPRRQAAPTMPGEDDDTDAPGTRLRARAEIPYSYGGGNPFTRGNR